MSAPFKRPHNKRNFFLCLILTYVLFLVGSTTVLTLLLSPTVLPENVDRSSLIFQTSANLTVVISMIAIPLGFIMMYLFGGFFSVTIMKLYLLVTRGKHIVIPKSPDSATNQPFATRLKLRRQIVYWLFILAVVVSFASYLGRRRIPLVASPGGLSDSSILASEISNSFVSLTIVASLVIPLVALALPYFGGLRLRSIDVGPFPTTFITAIVGISGGFTLLYTFFTKPAFQYVLYYVFLFMGVCWCLALGCNLAADPVNRRIVRRVYSARPSSNLIASRIWLENPPGRLFEV